MPRTLDYYFSLLSPWAYIGHASLMDIVGRHGLTVNYKPVALVQVFADTGGLPLPKRHPARQRYRMFELQRWREKRGLLPPSSQVLAVRREPGGSLRDRHRGRRP